MKPILTAIALLFTIVLNAQTAADTTVYTNIQVDEVPKLKNNAAYNSDGLWECDGIGETAAFRTIEVLCIVGADGKPYDAEVKESLSACYDKEALRIISNMEFIPGKKAGKPVKVSMVIPISLWVPAAGK